MEPANYPSSFNRKDIQEEANDLLRFTIRNFKYILPEYHWTIRSQEDQNDKGIDFECEIQNRSNGITSYIFKIQNKGSSLKLTPLKSTDNQGLIAYQLKTRTARYYRNEINAPMIFCVCDLTENIIYWHAIQLDNSIDERIINSINNDTESISIYIDPNKTLKKENLDKLIHDIHFSYIEQNERFSIALDRSFVKIPKTFPIDNSKSIIDQLYDFIVNVYSNLNFVPLEFIGQSYPFNLTPNNHYYNIENFSINTNNNELFNFINSIEILDKTLLFKENKYLGNTENYNYKISVILEKLTQNLVYKIFNNKNRKSKKTKFFPKKDCTCCVCTLKKYNIFNANINVEDSNITYQDLLKIAYTKYSLGNYSQAFDTLYRLSKNTDSLSYAVLHYITVYNLSKLVLYIRIYDSEYYENHIEKFSHYQNEAVNIAYQKFKRSSYGYIIDKIHDESLLVEKFFTLQKIVSNIRDHYYSHLNGGKSMNNNIDSLVYEYAYIERFISSNLLLCENSSYYKAIHELFLEGIFASHGINENHYHRLYQIDEWIIIKLFEYSESDKIIRYFNRYGLSVIKYKAKEEDDYINIILNLINSLIKLNTDQISLPSNVYNNFIRKLDNIILLIALTDIDNHVVNLILDNLLNLFKISKHIQFNTLRYFQILIGRKGKIFTKQHMIKLLEISVNNSSFHDDNYFRVLSSVYSKHFSNIIISKKVNSKAVSYFTKKCKLCNFDHSLLILIYYYHLNNNIHIKTTINEKIENTIKNNFDFDIISTALLLDVVDYNEVLIYKLINSISVKQDTDLDDLFIKNNYASNLHLNTLINIAYKFEIDLTSSHFDKFRHINDYYDWLLDMENFNYSKFNPEWIIEYETYYYHCKLIRFPIIKELTDSYLKKHNHYRLKKEYHQIFFLSPSID